MLPSSRDGRGSVGGARASLTIAALAVAGAWIGCSSPETYHAGQANLSTGAAGAAGTGSVAAGQGGTIGGAGAGALGGDGGAAGAAGDGSSFAGASGAAGSGTAGAGAAGAGAAGTGAAGSGAAGAGGAGDSSGAAGAAGVGAAGAGAAGAAGAGAAGAAAPPTPLALPVTVSDNFRPTGGMGDATVAGAVTIGTDATPCDGAPGAADKGACYTVTYHPQPFAAGANSTWAGFYWQYPDDNWGSMAPHTIASGAKDISFYAKGMAGGESITFEAGGILNTVSAATPYTDGFTVSMTFELTTTWTKYTLPMTGLTYSGGVLGAFGWVTSVSSTNPVTFFIDGLVWE